MFSMFYDGADWGIKYKFYLFLDIKIGAIIANNNITLVINNKNAPVV